MLVIDWVMVAGWDGVQWVYSERRSRGTKGSKHAVG